MLIPLSKAKERIKPARLFIVSGFLAFLFASFMLVTDRADTSKTPSPIASELSTNTLASDATDNPKGTSPSSLVATITDSAQKCDGFSGTGNQIQTAEVSDPAYTKIMAAHDVCFKSFQSIHNTEIAFHLPEYEIDNLKILRSKCSDAYYFRAVALQSLANSQYDFKNDEYSPDNPDQVRARDFSDYQREAGEADKAIEVCKSFLREWGT